MKKKSIQTKNVNYHHHHLNEYHYCVPSEPRTPTLTATSARPSSPSRPWFAGSRRRSGHCSPASWTLSGRCLRAHGEQKRSEIKLQLVALFTRGSVASPLTFVPKHRAQVVRSLLDDARHDDFAARLDENVRRTQYPGSKFYQKKKRTHKKNGISSVRPKVRNVPNSIEKFRCAHKSCRKICCESSWSPKWEWRAERACLLTNILMKFFFRSRMGKSLRSGVNQIVVQFLPWLGCIWWGRDRNRVFECDGEDNNWKKYPCSIKYESGYFSIAIWRFIFILFFNWCRDLARASKCMEVESVFRWL